MEEEDVLKGVVVDMLRSLLLLSSDYLNISETFRLAASPSASSSSSAGSHASYVALNLVPPRLASLRYRFHHLRRLAPEIPELDRSASHLLHSLRPSKVGQAGEFRDGR